MGPQYDVCVMRFVLLSQWDQGRIFARMPPDGNHVV
jgi:hypothetical protein